MEVTQAGGTQAEPATQPQAGNPPTTTPANPPAGADPTTTTQAANASEQMSLDEAKKLRQEHNALRKRLAEFEAAQKAADDAKLSETEKLAKRAEKAEADHKAALTELQEYRLRFTALDTGTEIGLTTPKAVDAALKLMDRAALEFDESGKPTNLPKVLKATVAEYPFLAANGSTQQPAQAGQRPPSSSGGATNPGGAGGIQGQGVIFTRDQINRMSPAEYERNKAAIYDQMAKNLIR